MVNVAFLFTPSAKVPFEFTDKHILQIKEACGGEVYRFGTEEELLASGLNAEVLFTWGGSGEIPVRYCMQNPNLKWFHSFSSGLDPVMKSSIASLPIIITNSAGIHSKTISEHTMGFILAHNRTFQFMFQKQREHVWAKGMTRFPTEAYGKTLGIVGAGAIGTEIARKAKAFNMYVIGLRRNPKPESCYDEVMSSNQIDELLSRSDYVVVSTPLTPATTHLINADRLAKMKPTGLLINVARGAVVDEAALIDALREHKIGGAALDVTEIEPLPADSPLWDLENVMITPHMSADGPLLSQMAIDFFCDCLGLYQAGKPVPNTVEH